MQYNLKFILCSFVELCLKMNRVASIWLVVQVVSPSKLQLGQLQLTMNAMSAKMRSGDHSIIIDHRA